MIIVRNSYSAVYLKDTFWNNISFNGTITSLKEKCCSYLMSKKEHRCIPADAKVVFALKALMGWGLGVSEKAHTLIKVEKIISTCDQVWLASSTQLPPYTYSRSYLDFLDCEIWHEDNFDSHKRIIKLFKCDNSAKSEVLMTESFSLLQHHNSDILAYRLVDLSFCLILGQ